MAANPQVTDAAVADSDEPPGRQLAECPSPPEDT
jgi:hypothetical protein